MTAHPVLRRDIRDDQYRVLAVLEHLQTGHDTAMATTAAHLALLTGKHVPTVDRVLLELGEKGLVVAFDDCRWAPVSQDVPGRCDGCGGEDEPVTTRGARQLCPSCWETETFTPEEA
jgi:hypothetical protein